MCQQNPSSLTTHVALSAGISLIRKTECAGDGEDGLEQQELQRIAEEQAEWREHVVVEDTRFYTTGPRRGGQVRLLGLTDSQWSCSCAAECHGCAGMASSDGIVLLVMLFAVVALIVKRSVLHTSVQGQIIIPYAHKARFPVLGILWDSFPLEDVGVATLWA